MRPCPGPPCPAPRRTRMRRHPRRIVLALVAALSGLSPVPAEPQGDRPGWVKGKGWGWIWGKDDEVGSLNAMTDASRAAALSLAKKGEVFDLGQTYSRRSF